MDPTTKESYQPVLNQIADFLLVKLRIRARKHVQNAYYYYLAMTSKKSKSVLRHYFANYPLLSSKRNDYDYWCAVDDLITEKTHLTAEAQIKINQFKLNMNSNRVHFNWTHLNHN